MAGGVLTSKNDPKKGKSFWGVNDNESLNESKPSFAPVNFSLRGILGLNQSVEIHKSQTEKLWTKENFHLNIIGEQERKALESKQQELESVVEQLKLEVKKLTVATSELDSNLSHATMENIPEANEYQVSFLLRLKNLVIAFRRNINEASCWLDSFNSKKKKQKNSGYWKNLKSKGGLKYLMSDEHSAARSGD
ncbi:MAG: DUF5660 family protein [Candidatus Shapirobacteria bacterium]